mgnify:CR=1 FL=1
MEMCKFVIHSAVKKLICQWQTDWYQFSEIMATPLSTLQGNAAMLELKLTSCTFKLLTLSSNYKCWILSKMNASLHSYWFMWVTNRSEFKFKLAKTTQLCLMFTMYKVKLHMKCSFDLKSMSLCDQLIISSITLHSYLKIEPNWLKATPSKKECMTIIW